MITDPVLATLAAAVLGVTAPPVALPPSGPASVPASTCVSSSSSSGPPDAATAAAVERVRRTAEELAARAREGGSHRELAARVREEVLAALPPAATVGEQAGSSPPGPPAGVSPPGTGTVPPAAGAELIPGGDRWGLRSEGPVPDGDGWVTPVPLGAPASGDDKTSGGSPGDKTSGDGPATGGSAAGDDKTSGGPSAPPSARPSAPAAPSSPAPPAVPAPSTRPSPSSSTTCTTGEAAQAAQAGLELAAAVTGLVERILGTLAAAGIPVGPAARDSRGDGADSAEGSDRSEESDNGSDDGSDESGGDSGDDAGNDSGDGGSGGPDNRDSSDDSTGGTGPGRSGGTGGPGAATPGAPGSSAPSAPGSSTPALPAPALPAPAPALPGTVPGSTVPPATPGPGSGPPAALHRALQDLAAALRASTDPEMQRLGDELLVVLAGAAATPAPAPAPYPAPATPATPAVPSVLPSGLVPLFTDDFEHGDLSKWGTCQGAGVNGDCAGLEPASGMGVGPDPERGMVAQFRITDGRSAEMGGERSEVRDDDPEMVVREGDERWYSWSMKFPQDFPEPDGGYYIVMQWHQAGDSGSPPLALDISRGSLDIGGDGVDAPRQTIGPIRRGEWVDYVLHARFSQQDGFVEAWENGVQTVERVTRPTMTDAENYIKMGIYRDEGSTGDAEVWFDDFTIHGTDGPFASPSGGTDDT